jgi:hypothetical protein
MRDTRNGTLADQRDRHRVGAHAVAGNAAGGVGCAERRIDQADLTLLAALYAFLQEHRRRGDLDSGLDGDRVWMTCTCGAVINRSADDD